MIKELLLEKIKERKSQEEHTPYIRSSEIGGCPVASALRLKGYKPQVEDDKLLIFEIGNSIHINMQSVLGDLLEDVEKEFIDKKLGVSGHIDGRIGDTVIEFKSISPYALQKARNELPYQHHIDQVHLYMHFTGLKKALIVYIEKSSGDILEYEVGWDEERWQKLKEKIEYIKSLVEKDEQEFANETIEKLGIEEWHCKYCFYNENCPAKENVARQFEERLF